MERFRERVPFDGIVIAWIPSTIFALAAGSSSVRAVNEAGKTVRWVMLVALLALAATWTLWRRERRSLHPTVAAAAVIFLALAAVSSLWSVDARLSFERAGAFAIVLATAALLAAAPKPKLVLGGLLAGTAAVALAGLVVLAVDYNTAVVAAFRGQPARFRGFGENPDTAPLLLALGVPIALAAGLSTRRTPMRVFAGAALTLLIGSIVASGSRGGLLGAAAGALVPAAACPRSPRGRLLVVAAVLLALAVGAYISSIPKPGTALSPQATAGPAHRTARAPYADVELVDPLDAEIGRPRNVAGPGVLTRAFFGSSGRIDAWAGAIRQAVARPIVGYGFGTEERVFVDRYYRFAGGLPESSYVGIGLQLGAVGLLALVALLASLGLAGRSALRGPHTYVVIAGLGVLAAGAVLAAVQSFLYSPGDLASLTFWSAAFLPAAYTLDHTTGRARGRALPRVSKRFGVHAGWTARRVAVVAVVAAGCVAAVVTGRVERRNWIAAQLRGMALIRSLVGPLDGPALSGYRVLPSFDCLVYRRGSNPFALDLCVDGTGRVVEAIERGRTTRRIYSLRAEHTASTLRIDRAEVARLVRMMQADP